VSGEVPDEPYRSGSEHAVCSLGLSFRVFSTPIFIGLFFRQAPGFFQYFVR
jgi:hypothetical protein